jgi:release factor glutamine methyltransferase
MTISQEYNQFKERLTSIYDERESEVISDWVFENVTGMQKWERRNNQQTMAPDQALRLHSVLKELMLHRPVQYILGEAWFYKMKFFVNEHVLIPRPETEELVEWIINDHKNLSDDFNNKSSFSIIDIGTGSGCIPISLKKAMPAADLSAIDTSEEALLVANKNAQELNATISFHLLNFLQEDQWSGLSQYDVIISNPPYIPINEKELLVKNVTQYEPGIALFVPDDDPYIFYKKIAAFSRLHLKPGGKIYVEVHEAFAQPVKAIFESAGLMATIKKDIYGKERMVKAEGV